jgi:bifunctional oligoribonuclease and PAP phosphatase NrnA
MSDQMTAKVGALEEAAAVIERGRRFLVTAHARPDGDALGSMLATWHGLRALGKDATLYNRDPAPARFAFLDGARELRNAVAPDARFDACIVHDCGDARLLGHNFPPREVTGPLVVLDHHATTRDFGDVVVRDPAAAAVGVLVARLFTRLGVTLTRPMAEALFCSMVSDTGWFRYSSTNEEVFRLAAACVAAGAQPWAFALRADEEWPPARLRLLNLVLATLEVRGRGALLQLTDDMLHEAGGGPELADGFVNYARGLAGVEIGAMLTVTRREVRVSLRSKGGADVGALAARFGGGGHRAAAGCALPLPLDAARAALWAEIARAVEAIDPETDENTPTRGGAK